MHRAQYNTRKPWLVDFITTTSGHGAQPRMLSLIKSNIIPGNSLCRTASDGQVSIKCIFGKACLVRFRKSWDNDTPPVIENVQIFVKQFELMFYLGENQSDCEFWLQINEFSLADALPAYFKGLIQNCMCIARVQEKANLLWTQSLKTSLSEKSKLHSTSSANLSLLLAQMLDSQNAPATSQASPGGQNGQQFDRLLADSSIAVSRFEDGPSTSSSESLADAQKFISSSESSAPVAAETDECWLAPVLNINDFLISDADARQLDAVEEWRDSCETNSVSADNASETGTGKLLPLTFHACPSSPSNRLPTASLHGEQQVEHLSDNLQLQGAAVDQPEPVCSTQVHDTVVAIPPIKISPVLKDTTQCNIIDQRATGSPEATCEYLFERRIEHVNSSQIFTSVQLNHSPGHSSVDREPCKVHGCVLHDANVCGVGASDFQKRDPVVHTTALIHQPARTAHAQSLQLGSLARDLEEEARLLAMLVSSGTLGQVTSQSTGLTSRQLTLDSPQLTVGQVTSSSPGLTPGQVTSQSLLLTHRHEISQSNVLAPLSSPPALTSGQVTSQSPGLTFAQVTCQSPAVTSGQMTSQSPGLTFAQLGCQSPTLTSGQVTSQSPGVTVAQVICQSPALTSGQVTSESPGLTFAQVTCQSPVLTSGQVTSQSPGLTFAQVACQSPVVTSGQVTSQSPGLTFSQVTCQSPAVTHGQVTSQSTGLTFAQVACPSPASISGQLITSQSPGLTLGQVTSHLPGITSGQMTSNIQKCTFRHITSPATTLSELIQTNSANHSLPVAVSSSENCVLAKSAVVHCCPNIVENGDKTPSSGASHSSSASSLYCKYIHDQLACTETSDDTNQSHIIVDKHREISSVDMTTDLRPIEEEEEGEDSIPVGLHDNSLMPVVDVSQEMAKHESMVVEAPSSGLFKKPATSSAANEKRATARNKKRTVFTPAHTLMETVPSCDKLCPSRRSSARLQKKQAFDSSVMYMRSERKRGEGTGKRSRRLYNESILLPEHISTEPGSIGDYTTSMSCSEVTTDRLGHTTTTTDVRSVCDVDSNVETSLSSMQTAVSDEKRHRGKNLRGTKTKACESGGLLSSRMTVDNEDESGENDVSCQTVDAQCKTAADISLCPAEDKSTASGATISAACDVYSSVMQKSHFDPTRIQELLQPDDVHTAHQMVLGNVLFDHGLHDFATEYFRQMKPIL